MFEALNKSNLETAKNASAASAAAASTAGALSNLPIPKKGGASGGGFMGLLSDIAVGAGFGFGFNRIRSKISMPGLGTRTRGAGVGGLFTEGGKRLSARAVLGLGGRGLLATAGFLTGPVGLTLTAATLVGPFLIDTIRKSPAFQKLKEDLAELGGNIEDALKPPADVLLNDTTLGTSNVPLELNDTIEHLDMTVKEYQEKLEDTQNYGVLGMTDSLAKLEESGLSFTEAALAMKSLNGEFEDKEGQEKVVEFVEKTGDKIDNISSGFLLGADLVQNEFKDGISDIMNGFFTALGLPVVGLNKLFDAGGPINLATKKLNEDISKNMEALGLNEQELRDLAIENQKGGLGLQIFDAITNSGNTNISGDNVALGFPMTAPTDLGSYSGMVEGYRQLGKND
jgi:hypothetical protein